MTNIVVGRIKGLHGVRGALKIESFCSPPAAIFNYKPWTLLRPGLSVVGGVNASMSDDADLSQAARSAVDRQVSQAASSAVDIQVLIRAPIKLHSSGTALVVRCAEIEDRDQAQQWLGSEIYVPKSALPKLPVGEYYWNDLIGLNVINRDGHAFGKIKQLMETGSNDVMIVAGERERLIPYLPGQFVLEIDLISQQMLVDWDADF